MKVIVSIGLMCSISTKLTGIVIGVAFFITLMSLPFGTWFAKISKDYQDALGTASTSR